MKKSFISKQTQCYTENDVYVLSFSESIEGGMSENYIILSRTCFPEDDKDLGPYIESSLGIEGYDLLSKMTINANKITLYLSNKAISCIEILLDNSDSSQINSVKQVFAKIANKKSENIHL